MKKLRRHLAVLLAAALLTGALYVPAAASQAEAPAGTRQAAAMEGSMESVETPAAGAAQEDGSTDEVYTGALGAEAAAAGDGDSPADTGSPALEAGDASADEDADRASHEDENADEDADPADPSGSSAAEEAGSGQDPGEDASAQGASAPAPAAQDDADGPDADAEDASGRGGEDAAAPASGGSVEDAASQDDEAGDPTDAAADTDTRTGADADAGAGAADQGGNGASNGASQSGTDASQDGGSGASGEEAVPAAVSGDSAGLTDGAAEEAATDAAAAALLEDETALGAQTLASDLTINGDAVIENGIVALNGHTLAVSGNLIQTGGVLLVDGGTLVVGGDYRIQGRSVSTDSQSGEATVTYGSGSGVLAMHNDDDYVKVEGSFYHSGNNYYQDKNDQRINDALTAGTLEIGTGLYQTLTNYSSFRASGTHRVLLKGSGARTVSFANDDARIAVLETEGTPDIAWQGFFRVEKLGSDVAVRTADEEGITLWSDNGKMDFYGHNLTVTGNVKAIRGKLYIGGASLAGDGSGDGLAGGGSGAGTRPQAMGSLTVDGNVCQAEDVVVVDGGSLTVTGDYRIQRKNSDGAYGSGSGVLAMHNDDDYVKVEGSFYHSGNNYYQDKNDQRINDVLTAGTLEIEGDFFQTLPNYSSFRASGTHRTVLSGTGTRFVQFASSDSECRFQTLDLSQDLSNYLFSRVPCWVTLTRNGKQVPEEAVEAIPYTVSLNADGETLTITGWKDDSAQIVIPEKLKGLTVTGIGKEVFQGRKDLTKLTLPATLTAIGESAFRGCTSLTQMQLPAALASIGNSAFYGCSTLAALTLPAGLTIIGNDAFRSCTALTQVTVPAKVTSIGSSAFRDCAALETLAFAEGSALKTIGGSAFENDRLLKAVTIPAGTKTIEAYAFYGCSALAKVSMPASVSGMGVQIFRNTAITSAGPAGSGADYEFGWTKEIPAYGFDWIDTLAELTLPDTITVLGNNAIAECQALPALRLPASLTTMGTEVFSGCEKLQSIDVPEGVAAIPDRAFRRCKAMTDVTLPDSVTEIGADAFLQCAALTVLDIPESVTRIKYHAFYDCSSLTQLTVPESVTSMDNSVQKTDKITMYVAAGSYAEQYAVDNDIPYAYISAAERVVTAVVKDPAGKAVTGGFDVYWYTEGADALLGTGAKLRNVQEGTKLLCRVVLSEELGVLYVQPDDVSYEMGAEGHTIEVTLTAFEEMTISGTVKDGGGAAIPGASVSLKQTFNGAFEKTSETQTNENGSFTFAAAKGRSALTFSADGFYDRTYALSDSSMKEDAVTLDAVLEKIPQDKITLSMVRQDAALEGEAPVFTQITNPGALAFTVYNETRKKSVTDFRIQYPYMTLGDGAASAGDTLRLGLTDPDGAMTGEDVTVTLDETRCGAVEWLLVQNGSIQFTGLKSNALSEDGTVPGTVVMLFDGQGLNRESGTAAASYTTGALPAGDYTCVFMEKTSMLRGLDSYGKLEELGLRSGTDFAAVTVRVQNGLITVKDGITVPDFDETKLYYTVSENTRFWANYSTAATAQYVTLRASYEIDSQYAGSGQAVTFEIPEGMEFVEESLTVDGRRASCSTKDRDDGGTTVFVQTGKAKGTVRFYVLPTASGSKKTYAYLSFTKDRESVLQPIGTVLVDVKAASITVPSRTGFRHVAASGKTARDSEVTVYDNGKKVGTTTANKNGSWRLEFDLVRPLNYSYHEIYAEVKSAEYGDIETEKAGILYNASFVELSKVTMINTAHPDDSLRPTEFRTVFDFLKPEGAVPTYNYWPSYPTFTFVVEFTGGDADTVSDVSVITRNSSGGRTLVPCSYDEGSGSWIGTHDYRSFSDVPCYVGVTCVNSSGEVIDDVMEIGDLTDFLTEAKGADNAIEAMAEAVASVDNETVSENSISFDVTIGEEKYGEYSMVLLDYADFDLEAWKKDRYVEYKEEDGSISYEATWINDDNLTTCTAYPEEQLYIRETLKLTPDPSASGTAAVTDSETASEISWGMASGRSSGTAFGAVSGTAAGSRSGFKAPLADSAVFTPAMNSLTLDWVTDTAYAGYRAKGDVMKLVKDVSGIQDVIDVYDRFAAVSANESTLYYDLDAYKKAIMQLKRKCKCITQADLDPFWKDADDIEKQIQDYRSRANLLTGGVLVANAVMNYCGGKVLKFGGKLAKAGGKWLYKAAMKKFGSQTSRSVRRCVFHGANIIAEESGGYIEKKMGDLTKYVTSLFDVKDVIQSGFTSLRDYIRASVKNLSVYKCPCEKGGGTCECEKEDPSEEDEEEDEPTEHGGGPDGGNYGFRSVVPKADPSGYVYEAVPSNRVEGVTATIYEYAEIIETDDYGQETGRRKEEVKWDAENYDQVNPQTTDAYGTFAWDVPEGEWVVKFSKDGYQDADSYGDAAATAVGGNGKHYLPVPPIQTEVNTAMVSKAAPQVGSVAAYPEEVRIDFTQYMDISTVSTANVTVTVGGKAVSGTLEPLNAEDNYEGTARYASSFAFRPSSGSLSGTVTVAVKTAKNVKNYCGTPMAAAYSKEAAVTVMPRSLEVTGAEQIPHHESGELTIQVLPAEAGANQTLTVTSFSPSILSVGGSASRTVTTDKNGRAAVTLGGALPGQGILTVALEGTKLETEKQITVLGADETPEIPAARSLEDGTYRISLSAETFTYNGKPQKPAVTVEGLTEGTDFTAAYSADTTNAGTKTVTITGAGIYTGTVTKQYTIAKAGISAAAVTGIANRTYNGKAQTQAVTVKLGSYTLKNGTDYTVTYKNNVNANASTAQTKPTVTLTGKGNFTGTVSKYFTIARAAQTLTVKAPAAVAVGSTAKVTASGAKETAKYTFTSSNTSVAAVSANGTVTGKKAGTVTITVTTPQTANYAKGSKAVKITVQLVLKKPGNCRFVKWNNAKYTGCQIAWNKTAGATGYQTLQSWTDGSHAVTKNLKAGVLSQNCTVAANHVSQFKVRAYADTAAGRVYSPWSNVVYITPSPATFNWKNTSTAAAVKAEISWNIIYGCNGYNVFLTTNPNGTWYWNQSTSIKAGSTSATITRYRGSKLKKNTTYYVRIVTRRQRNGVFCTVPMPAKNTSIGKFMIK